MIFSTNVIKAQAADHVHTDECKGTHVHTDLCYETYTKTFTGLTNKQQRFEIPIKSCTPKVNNSGKTTAGYPVIEFKITDIQGISSLDVGVDLEVNTTRVSVSGVHEAFAVYLNGERTSWSNSNGYLTFEAGRYSGTYEYDYETGQGYWTGPRIGTKYQIKDDAEIAFSNMQVGDSVMITPVWGLTTTIGWDGKPPRAYIRAMDTSGAEAHGSFTVTGRGMVCNGSVTNEEQLCNKVVTNISPKK